MPGDWLYYVLGFVLIVVNMLAAAGNLLGWPANWAICVATAIYAFGLPLQESGLGVSWFTVLLLVMLAGLGESLTFAVKKHQFQPPKQRRPVKGILAGAGVGSLLGVILGLAIPVIGSLLAILGSVGGAAIGAFLGTVATDLWGRPVQSESVSEQQLLWGMTRDNVLALPRTVTGGLMWLVATYAVFFE